MFSFSSALASLLTGVKSLFLPSAKQKVEAALGKAESLVYLALPVVEKIALLATDGSHSSYQDVLKAARLFLDPLEVPTTPLSDKQKGDLLFNAAVAGLEKELGKASGVSPKVIDTAIQIAYLAYSAAKGK